MTHLLGRLSSEIAVAVAVAIAQAVAVEAGMAVGRPIKTQSVAAIPGLGRPFAVMVGMVAVIIAVIMIAGIAIAVVMAAKQAKQRLSGSFDIAIAFGQRPLVSIG